MLVVMNLLAAFLLHTFFSWLLLLLYIVELVIAITLIIRFLPIA